MQDKRVCVKLHTADTIDTVNTVKSVNTVNIVNMVNSVDAQYCHDPQCYHYSHKGHLRACFYGTSQGMAETIGWKSCCTLGTI